MKNNKGCKSFIILNDRGEKTKWDFSVPFWSSEYWLYIGFLREICRLIEELIENNLNEKGDKEYGQYLKQVFNQLYNPWEDFVHYEQNEDAEKPQWLK